MTIPAKGQKQQANERLYQGVWNAIKAKPVGEAVEVRTHSSNVQRLIQAVKKEKNRDVGIKNKLGMLCPGDLRITHNPELVKGKVSEHSIVKFVLQWDGSKL